MSEPRKIKRTNFLVKGFHALMTFADWRAAGFPARDPEDVKAIFTEHCSQCPLYDPEGRAVVVIGPKGLCDDRRDFEGVRGCGCHVSPYASEWTNAVAYPVKPCPRGLFPQLIEPEQSE